MLFSRMVGVNSVKKKNHAIILSSDILTKQTEPDLEPEMDWCDLT